MIVVDAGALIAFQKPSDAHHRRATRALAIAPRPLLVHTLTLAESLVPPAKFGDEEKVLADLASLGLVRADLGDDEAALLARTRARYRLKMPDTCVLATAIHAAAPILTFDERLGAVAADLGLRFA